MHFRLTLGTGILFLFIFFSNISFGMKKESELYVPNKTRTWLLKSGADVSLIDSHGYSPLHCICKGYTEDTVNLDCVKSLLQKGGASLIDCKNKTVCGLQDTPLHIACAQREKADLVELLLKYGANPNIEDGYYETPLWKATFKNYKKTVILLLKYGANPDCYNYNYDTPLLRAAYNGFSEIAQILIEKKANVNCACKSGYTPLHWAFLFEHIKIVKLLLANGGDIYLRNKQGLTPLAYARKFAQSVNRDANCLAPIESDEPRIRLNLINNQRLINILKVQTANFILNSVQLLKRK